jgi:hypothetical protein
VIDSPTSIDPLVAEGPRTPLETLRPAVSLQRVLILDEPGPLMADLATGDIRRYESGPPVSVPMVSEVFDLGRVRRLQVQLIRDPRPSAVSQTLISLDIESSGSSAEVRITADNTLLLLPTGGFGSTLIVGPAGESPAFVIVVEQTNGLVTLSARNAETPDQISLECEPGDLSSVMTIGGPSTRASGEFGRRRSIPVHIEMQQHGEPVDQLHRVVRGARRVAGSIRDKAR